MNEKPKWKSLWTPSHKWYLLWLPAGAFVAILVGVIGTIAFNTVIHATNSNAFCYSCHVGMDTIVEEYQASSHYDQRHGVVKAECHDCHVPKEFFPKMVVKVTAMKDIYHKLVGTVNLDNFESLRGHQAEAVWQVYRENDSKFCRNCHNVETWDLSLQEKRARKKHDPQRWQERGETCIDCHSGIAHKLPED
ncbi:NapC/NirT family cytochrome c [Thalassotalea aquiviva]|uniref:NapC/NirT family cytochrome c n=1 Tax=Thalassotalea aquiviva TaxID=3242415 RepID=UPI00352A85C9